MLVFGLLFCLQSIKCSGSFSYSQRTTRLLTVSHWIFSLTQLDSSNMFTLLSKSMSWWSLFFSPPSDSSAIGSLQCRNDYSTHIHCSWTKTSHTHLQLFHMAVFRNRLDRQCCTGQWNHKFKVMWLSEQFKLLCIFSSASHYEGAWSLPVYLFLPHPKMQQDTLKSTAATTPVCLSSMQRTSFSSRFLMWRSSPRLLTFTFKVELHLTLQV